MIIPSGGLCHSYPKWNAVLRFNGQTFAAILGVLGFQFWMGLRSPELPAAYGLGVHLWILSAIPAFE